MKMPELPTGQRWSVHSSFNTFIIVKLQEKRWWGWSTIASSTGSLAGGDYEVEKCVDHILRRDYFAKLKAERDAKVAERIARIPFGTHGD